MLRILLISGIFLLLSSNTVSAQNVYVYKDDRGTIRFTSKKPASRFNAKTYNSKGTYSRYKVSNDPYKISKTRSAYNFKPGKVFSSKYSDIISQASVKHGVAADLIQAVIHTESAFNPRAKSHKGAMGLMQLMPSNVKIYGVKDPYSPQENIFAGTKLLSRLIRIYSGDTKLALAAYNAGEGAVKKI